MFRAFSRMLQAKNITVGRTNSSMDIRQLVTMPEQKDTRVTNIRPSPPASPLPTRNLLTNVLLLQEREERKKLLKRANRADISSWKTMPNLAIDTKCFHTHSAGSGKVDHNDNDADSFFDSTDSLACWDPTSVTETAEAEESQSTSCFVVLMEHLKGKMLKWVSMKRNTVHPFVHNVRACDHYTPCRCTYDNYDATNTHVRNFS